MKHTEIKWNICDIATDVFRDTKVLFAYLYGSYAIDQAHPFSDLDIGIYVPRLSQREKLDLEMTLALKIDKKLKQAWRVMSAYWIPFLWLSQARLLRRGC